MSELAMVCPPTTDALWLSIDSMRTFVQREIRPAAVALRDGAASRVQWQEITQAVAEFGLPGMTVPKALGGHGVDWVTHGRLFEELAIGSVELAGQVLLNTLVTTLVMQQPALCPRYLPDLVSGRTLAGITLNGPTSALFGRRKNGAWIIDGRCDHVAASLHADLLVAAVREHGKVASWLLLDRSEDRYELRHFHDIEGQKHRCLQMTQATLPAQRWLGDAGSTAAMTRHLFEVFKLHEAVIHLAQGRALLEASIARARTNTQFGRPIAAQHLVVKQFAELATQLDAARLMCGLGFQQLEAGQLDAQVASRARLLTTETARRIERSVSRIDHAHARQDGDAVWPDNGGPLSLLSEDITCDAQRIADQLIGELP